MFRLAVIAVALATLPASAHAQVCGPTDALMAELKSKFAEVPTFQATMGDKKQPVTVTVSPGGSWTVTVSPQPGISCLVGTGADWDVTAPAVIKPKLMPDGLSQDELLRWGRGGYLRTL